MWNNIGSLLYDYLGAAVAAVGVIVISAVAIVTAIAILLLILSGCLYVLGLITKAIERMN